jgi:ABC-type branched-subunit amino acid transport system substrate-binding protein
VIVSLLRGLLWAVLVAGLNVAFSRAEQAVVSPPILIGLLLPPEEAEADSLRRGAQLGVDHANLAPGDKAGLVIRGRVGQWGADGEEAGRMVLDDGVRGLIAPPGGAPSHLALQVSGRTAIPVISLCPDSSVTRAGIPWMVRLAPGTIAEALVILDEFKDTKPGTVYRWAALVPPERAGREAANDLRKAAEAAGRSLREPVKIAPAVSNYSEARRAVLTGKPDGILIWLDPEPAGRLARELRADGYGEVLCCPLPPLTAPASRSGPGSPRPIARVLASIRTPPPAWPTMPPGSWSAC